MESTSSMQLLESLEPRGIYVVTYLGSRILFLWVCPVALWTCTNSWYVVMVSFAVYLYALLERRWKIDFLNLLFYAFTYYHLGLVLREIASIHLLPTFSTPFRIFCTIAVSPLWLSSHVGVLIWVSIIMQKLFHAFDYNVHQCFLKLWFALLTSITGTCQKYFICLDIYCCKTYLDRP